MHVLTICLRTVSEDNTVSEVATELELDMFCRSVKGMAKRTEKGAHISTRGRVRIYVRERSYD